MSGAQLGKICGCSGLTGGQYLSKSVTATHPEEVETSCESYLAGAAFDIK